MMAISLGLFVLFTIKENSPMIKVMTMIYTIFFEISIGPILWLYLAEILPEQALSLAIFVNWGTVIGITFLTPILMTWNPAGTFGIFAVCCLLGFVFALFFMKETRGLKKEETEQLYIAPEFREVKSDSNDVAL